VPAKLSCNRLPPPPEFFAVTTPPSPWFQTTQATLTFPLFLFLPQKITLVLPPRPAKALFQPPPPPPEYFSDDTASCAWCATIQDSLTFSVCLFCRVISRMLMVIHLKSRDKSNYEFLLSDVIHFFWGNFLVAGFHILIYWSLTGQAQDHSRKWNGTKNTARRKRTPQKLNTLTGFNCI